MEALRGEKRLSVVSRHLIQKPAASGSVEFIPFREAAKMKQGTRITMVPGAPALWSECLKNICYVKRIPVIRVVHPQMGVDKATGEDRQKLLYEVTSQKSLPTMLHDEERPRNVWSEQLALAEQIGAPDAPKLIPEDMEERVLMFGLCAVVLSEGGFGWNKRLIGPPNPLSQKYGYSPEASAAAPGKIVEILQLFDRRLAAQADRGSAFLVGNALTAADVYWATMTFMVAPPGPDILPRTKQNQGLLQFFNFNPPEVKASITVRILAHRDFILKTYCEVPAVLGGDPI